MYLIFFLVLLISALILALFMELAYVTFGLNTDAQELLITVSWFRKAVFVQFQQKGPSKKLSVHLSKQCILSRTIHPKQRHGRNYWSDFHALSLEQARCHAFYGFSDPFLTGISSGFSPAVQSAVPNIPIEMTPDFFSDHAYLIVEAESKINPGKTLVNLLRNKIDKRSNKNYG